MVNYCLAHTLDCTAHFTYRGEGGDWRDELVKALLVEYPQELILFHHLHQQHPT